MSTPIPPPLRAVAGLAAVAIDNARKLPEQLVGLPVLAVSAALQVSLKTQQRYAALVARGDELLGQLRGLEDEPAWARFDDEPGPVGRPARPPSAFDTVVEPTAFATAADPAAFDTAAEPAPAGEDALLDELAADQLSAGEAEAGLLADATADRDGPVLEPDGVTATEAEAGGLDVAEVPLDGTEVPLDGTAPGVDLPAGTVTGGAAGSGGAGRGTEPGVDLPADAADAADTEAALSAVVAGREPGSVGEPGVDLPAGLAEGAAAVEEALDDSAPADPTAGLDGYLAVEPPIPHYDELSIPQLRGRLRALSEQQIEALVAYERSTAARPPYLTMLENRLVTLRSR